MDADLARGLELFDDHPSLRIHENVVAIAIFAGGGVVAVGVALRADDLIAGVAVQNDGRLQIVAQGVVSGHGGAADEREHRQRKNGYRLLHSFLRYGKSDFPERFRIGENAPRSFPVRRRQPLPVVRPSPARASPH